jgi:hypothetical protein
MRRVSAALMVVVLSLGFASFAHAQSDQRCFTETNQCISGRIRAFWEQNGGLPVFGFPTGPQQNTMIAGKPFQAQTFERNRLELHPENQPPYDVLLGRLGVDWLAQQGRDWKTFPKADPSAPHYYAQTGHAIAPQFWSYRSSHGLEFDGQAGTSEAESLALIGLPLSEPATETNASGATVLTQWFERARFELHPENQPPYDILLGLLGNEIRDHAAPPVSPAPTVSPAPPAQTGTLAITQAPSTVRRGNVATIAVHTTPGATCTITVEYKSGPSHAHGLDPKQADSNGNVIWSWIVGTNTTPGSWPVIITCGGQTVRTAVTVI